MKSQFYIQILLIIFLNIKFSLLEEIQNGLYIIKNKANFNLCLKNTSLYFSSEESCQFLIHKKDTKPLHEYDFEPKDKNIYYYIEDEITGNKLYFDEITKSLSVSDDLNTKGDSSNFLWEFIVKKDKNSQELFYEIKSKIKKFFISYEDSKEKTTKAFCESSWTALTEDRDTKIKLIQIYHENEDKSESKILEKEPIDVVIKYIDLNDENLDRKNLEQFTKDKHNNELKYSLRSIFKNIPWIRKIFIIMPNNKIDFLKDEEEIKKKIVFIKDSDLLGFDSSSPPALQFNLHKLKENKLSENFILMDDDYFIGQPLKKSDLFYDHKGKVYPYIISTKYFQINPEEIKEKYMNGMNNIDEIKYNSREGFEFRKISTLLFLYKILDDNYDTNNFIGVEYTHNTIPLKLSDVEEVYNSIEKDYKYSEYCLRGNKRTLHNLQPQILFMNYAKNKYDRFVNKISWKYYDLSDVDKVNLDSKLFVINREDKDYENEIFKKEEDILKKLFPEKNKYEKGYIGKDDNDDEDLTENNQEIKDNNNGELINEYIEANKNLPKEKEKEEKINEEKSKEEKKEDKKDEENRKEKDNDKINEKENEKMKEQTKEENKKDKKNSLLEETIEELKKEISNHNNEYKEKFDNLLKEIKILKTELQKNPTYDTISDTKLQVLIDTQKELSEKISSLEKENKDLKKSQNEIFEKISKNEKDKDNKEGDNNALIQIFDDIKGRNTKLEDQLKNLSEDNNSLSKKLSSMEENVKEKENQISKLSEENSELKSQINELKSLIETKNKDLENLLEKNDEKINLLNNAINQLRQSLEENKIENRKDYKLNDEKNRDNTITKGDNDYKLSYVIVFLFICVVVIYVIYRVYYGRDEGDSRKIKHMKLSSHSGYGSISSNSFM